MCAKITQLAAVSGMFRFSWGCLHSVPSPDTSSSPESPSEILQRKQKWTWGVRGENSSNALHVFLS